MFDTFDISGSGLTAERLRMDVISNNIANANTTRTEDGEPYRRQMPVFETRGKSFSDHLHSFLQKDGDFDSQGVRVSSIEEDDSPFKEIYDPEHPEADPETGYVQKPNVEIVKEMTDMITASRAYEANATAIDNAKSMASNTLDIGR
ncbi:flagellar basal body rod protein FlgC [Natranaerobius thermophilus]|uniref:Flagellar basal-body rod protein FlgC n=1 Tax=Natranaerobius thermophilus (strain ATCC BAA-1301 / DSM 18059 / JW/NM-WN-LF) TaxID=457570 RepID=B2A341_NATTJ|nr:flagellar basal body rod protein FlgC [Natranaerobius thermophilus]ACB84972.1 flagellar basal-body rod protein FlgC [Natranaerobius thermophilus JW/NM-WN-LF]